MSRKGGDPHGERKKSEREKRDHRNDHHDRNGHHMHPIDLVTILSLAYGQHKQTCLAHFARLFLLP